MPLFTRTEFWRYTWNCWKARHKQDETVGRHLVFAMTGLTRDLPAITLKGAQIVSIYIPAHFLLIDTGRIYSDQSTLVAFAYEM